MKSFAAVVVVVAVVCLLLAGAAMPRTSVAGVAAASVPSAKAVSTGVTDSCALFSGGRVQCWGYNADGQLGNGTSVDSLAPVSVKGLRGAIAVSVGTADTCALLVGGTVKCWGYDVTGQLGNGKASVYLSLTPVSVKGLRGAKAVSVGDGVACALLSGGIVKCWGSNSQGQLGAGKVAAYSATPLAVKGLRGAKAVSTSGPTSCALLVGGTVKCWGYNGTGQLGNGTTINSLTPVAVAGISSAIAVSVSETHSCAVLSGGVVQCWGYVSDAQNSLTPVAIPGIATAKSISVGYFLSASDSCALLSGGTIDCWGSNQFGQLGNGTVSAFPTSTPVAVSGISTATAVGTGGPDTCALLAGGSVECWGGNGQGELGNGTNRSSSTPVVVRFRSQ